MCYIICTSSSFCALCRARREVNFLCVGIWGQRPQEKNFFLGKRVTYLGGFSTHGFFADGFLFPVKELGLLTNTGHWVRVLDATSSYIYIVL
jgi:hypothetical protein